jgi:hypothetical protein
VALLRAAVIVGLTALFFLFPVLFPRLLRAC